MSAMLMLSGCAERTVSISSGDSSYEDSDEEETTSKSSQKSSKTDDEEETTNKSTKKSSKKDDEDDEETTSSKKSSKKDKGDEEEETTTKASGNSHSTAPSGWTEFRGTGYSIYLDGDEWTKTSLAGSELAFTHLGTAVNGFTENINIITQDTSAYDIDLEAYKDLSLQQYDQLGYDLIEVEDMEINGQEGYYIVTSTVQDGTKCYIAQWFTLINDTAYVYTFAADEEDFDDLESEVMMIYDTIEFE